MRQYRIPATNLARLQDEIAKLNKRARKLRVGAVSCRVVGWDERTVTHPVTGVEYTKRWALVEVEGRTPKLDGWSFVAKLTPTEAGNIIGLLPGVEAIPEEYRACGPYCDHCKVKRYRKETFVVRHDGGRYAQVGRNCLADFLGGESPERLATVAEFDLDLSSLADDAETDDWGGYGRIELSEDTEAYLSVVAAFNRRVGWVSRTKAGPFETATADLAWDFIFDRKINEEWTKDGFTVIEADLQTARSAIAWARTIEPANDYEHNLKVSATLEHVERSTAGILASAVRAYTRHAEKMEAERVRREANAGLTYVGEVGKRQEFDGLTVAAIYEFAGFYGVSNIIKLHDPKGNVLVWKTSTRPEWAEQGTEGLRVVARVKSHDEYKGEPQTVITRVKAA